MQREPDSNDWLAGWQNQPAAPSPEASSPSKAPKRRIWTGAGLVAAGAVAGGVLAGALTANAATGTSSGTPAPGGYAGSSSSSESNQPSRPNFPPHGSAAHEALEKPVSGTNETKAQAAAVQIVGSGSKAGAVTTDATGQGYEVTVTKSDGSTVEIHLNASFAQEQHGPMGPHAGRPDGDGPGGYGYGG